MIKPIVFISHSSDDSDFAKKICSFLEGHGIKCWIAPRDISPGAAYSGEITRRIKECQIFLVILTQHSVLSLHVNTETDIAFNSNKQIIPFFAEDVVLGDSMSYYLARKQWILGYKDFDASLNALLDSINPNGERIFISYKQVDKDRVFEIKHLIESHIGEECWIDLEGIESDAQFMNVIINAINNCEVVLFMYSKAHTEIRDFEKDWTVRELNFASTKNKRIVFVNIDGTPLTDEFSFNYGQQQVDANSSDAMKRLITDLRKWLNLPGPNPPIPKYIKKKLICWGGGGVFAVIAVALLIALFWSKKPVDKPTPLVGLHYDESTEELVDGSNRYKMVQVDGGSFYMGATAEQKNSGIDENPEHRVKLSTYHIGKTEVPQWLWKAVMGSNPSSRKGDNLPVEYVSWEDCEKFISKLNSLTGKNFCFPTEAQWEYAARGGCRSSGYQYSGSDDIDSVAWHGSNSNDQTHEVGTKKANELGLYDMSGNVYEWCSDWYGEYPDSCVSDPAGLTSGTYRVRRGGGYSSILRRCRVAYRDDLTPSRRSYSLGLRLALD